MSYILDSLKKSEQKRQEKNVPDLNTVHVEDAPVRRRFWPYLMLLIFGINLILLLVWFAPWSTEEMTPPVTTGNLPVQQRQGQVSKESSPVKHAQPVRVASPVTEPMETDSAATAGEIPSASVKKALPPEGPKRMSFQETPAGVAGGQKSSDPSIVDRLYLPTELPADVAAQLPELSLTLHYYSRKSEARMVRIDGDNLREGGELKSGVTVGEITPHGVVVQVPGYRVWLKKP